MIENRMVYDALEPTEDEKHLAELDKLNTDIDQLASMAEDCEDVAPQAASALALAWWYTEEALRAERSTGGSCGHKLTYGEVWRKQEGARRGEEYRYCQCCHHFASLANKAEAARRYL